MRICNELILLMVVIYICRTQERCGCNNIQFPTEFRCGWRCVCACCVVYDFAQSCNANLNFPLLFSQMVALGNSIRKEKRSEFTDTSHLNCGERSNNRHCRRHSSCVSGASSNAFPGLYLFSHFSQASNRTLPKIISIRWIWG